MTSPVFLTLIVYRRISPLSIFSSPSSIILTDLDTVIEGLWMNITSVGSSILFPSSIPSSLVSETSLLFPGLLPVTRTLFRIPPLSKASWLMVYFVTKSTLPPTKINVGEEPFEDDSNVGLLSSWSDWPLKSVRVSIRLMFLKVVSPVFSTLMI